MKVYTVLSRDNSSFIYTTTIKKDAEIVKLKQIEHEEMSGGRPSVYILESNLKQ